MSALSLSCRVCATEHPLEATGSCSRCFGRLDPGYDWDRVSEAFTPERLANGPRTIWRYAPLLPVDAPEKPRLAPGFTPLVPAPRLAEEVGVGELWLKLDTANPTHSSRTASSRSRHARRRSSASRRSSCSSTGNLAGAVAARAAAEGLEAAVFVPADLEPEKLERRGRVRADALRRRRPLRPLLAPLRGALVRAALGLRQRQPPGVLRRGLEDARLRGRRGARLAGARRDRDPDRVRGALPQGRAGALGAPVARARRRPVDAARRRPGGGLPAVATAFREGTPVTPVRPDSIARSLAIGSPADGDFAVATAARRAARSTPSPRTRSERTWRCSPARPASSGRRRPA